MFICDAIPGTVWYDAIEDVDTGINVLGRMTRADIERREYLAVITAEQDDDGEIDYETVEEVAVFIIDGKPQSFQTETYEYNAEDDTERWRGGTEPEWAWTDWKDAVWQNH